MKDTLYFRTHYTQWEHEYLENLLREELEKRGCELIYYRQFKRGHVPMWREGKTDARRSTLLDICAEFNIDIESGGYAYKNGVMERELYDWPK